VGDAHAGSGRQVSLLARESIAKMQAEGLSVGPGDFAENLTTEGIVLHTYPVGTRLRVGATTLLEITQIGKACHTDCDVKRLTGRCVMPTEGVFARVLVSGEVKPGDEIKILEGAGEGSDPDRQ
jgi:MOSC domain-containing protein YiiM